MGLDQPESNDPIYLVKENEIALAGKYDGKT